MSEPKEIRDNLGNVYERRDNGDLVCRLANPGTITHLIVDGKVVLLHALAQRVLVRPGAGVPISIEAFAESTPAAQPAKPPLEYGITDEAITEAVRMLDENRDRPVEDRAAFLGQVIRMAAATVAGVARAEERRSRPAPEAVARAALVDAAGRLSNWPHIAGMLRGIAIDPDAIARIVEAARTGR